MSGHWATHTGPTLASHHTQTPRWQVVHLRILTQVGTPRQLVTYFWVRGLPWLAPVQVLQGCMIRQSYRHITARVMYHTWWRPCATKRPPVDNEQGTPIMPPRCRICPRTGVGVMLDCTAVLQSFMGNSWIDWIGDYRSVTDYSPHINHIVSGGRSRPVQAGASKLRANEVNLITLRWVIPELLYELKVLFHSSVPGWCMMLDAIRALNKRISRP